MVFGFEISVIVDLGHQFGRAAPSAQACFRIVSDSLMAVLLLLGDDDGSNFQKL
jgi:hypothetical protein